LQRPFYRQSEITPPQHGNGPSVRILLGRTPIERRALERRLRLRIEQLHKELLKSPKGRVRRGVAPWSAPCKRKPRLDGGVSYHRSLAPGSRHLRIGCPALLGHLSRGLIAGAAASGLRVSAARCASHAGTARGIALPRRGRLLLPLLACWRLIILRRSDAGRN
jgi:hypothetical protein